MTPARAARCWAVQPDVSSALGLDLTAIASEHSGLPQLRDAGLALKASTAALSVSAHMDFGQGWVTTAFFQ
jgi:hypothetical protein